MARRPVPRPARIRGRLTGAGSEARPSRPPVGAARPGSVLLRARALGDRSRLVRARLPEGTRVLRADRTRVPARAVARRQLAVAEGSRERLHPRRADRGEPDAFERGRLLPAPADVPARRRTRARGRVPGTQAV